MEDFVSGICAFFGHRDTPATIELENKLEQAVRNLIAHGVDEFWVCNEGNFDWISRMVMQRIKENFGSIVHVCYVSAYNPDKYTKIRQDWLEERYDEIIYTNEIANGPQKFAIKRRNNYIADNTDYIICYITQNYGGAYEAVQRAKKNHKQIINIAEI